MNQSIHEGLTYMVKRIQAMRHKRFTALAHHSVDIDSINGLAAYVSYPVNYIDNAIKQTTRVNE